MFLNPLSCCCFQCPWRLGQAGKQKRLGAGVLAPFVVLSWLAPETSEPLPVLSRAGRIADGRHHLLFFPLFMRLYSVNINAAHINKLAYIHHTYNTYVYVQHAHIQTSKLSLLFCPPMFIIILMSPYTSFFTPPSIHLDELLCLPSHLHTAQ